ncbi:MAG: phage tail protein [Caldilineaceae bacterium]|nr:phage tail protein [Caldilineaceae bacterium]
MAESTGGAATGGSVASGDSGVGAGGEAPPEETVTVETTPEPTPPPTPPTSTPPPQAGGVADTAESVVRGVVPFLPPTGGSEVPNIVSRTVFPPLIDFQFSITIGPAVGIPVSYATEVSGLDFEREYIEHKYVGDKFQAFTQMVPGRIKYQPVTIKQLLSTDSFMWNWFLAHEGTTGNFGNYTPLSYETGRYPVTIIAYTRDFIPAITWFLMNAWPSKVTGPSMKTSGGEFSIEEVTLVYDSMTRASNLLAGAMGAVSSII